MATVYQYRFFCSTESAFVTSWGTEPPTHCPNDQTVISDVTIISSVAPNTMAVTGTITAQDASPPEGWYQSSTIQMDIPSGATGSITTYDWANVFDTYIWSVSITPPPNSEGDVLTYIIVPDTVIGTLASDATIGSTAVNIGANAPGFYYLTKGCEISLTDGVNTQYPDKITSVNPSTGVVTFEAALTYNFATGTYIRFTNYTIRDHIMDYHGERMYFGLKGLKTKMVPAGYPMRLIYKNKTGVAKTFYFQMEYYMT